MISANDASASRTILASLLVSRVPLTLISASCCIITPSAVLARNVVDLDHPPLRRAVQ
jgi:hypothetical protein